MSLLERLTAARHYRPFIEAVGPADLQLALHWSLWYAVKWWEEVFHELGLEAVRRNPFARALYISLRLRGHVREDGHVARRPARPEYPTNRYAIEFVELHEAFDRLGAANVASNNVDENAVRMLQAAMQSQDWHRLLRRAFLELMEIYRDAAVVEPLVGGGHLALAVFDLHRPEIYLGYDPRGDDVEVAAALLGGRIDSCEGRGVCLYRAPNACEFAKMARDALPRGADSAILFDSLARMEDPVRDLACLRRVLKPWAQVLVGQQVVESAPGLLAVSAALGAKHVLSWKGVERLLASAGYGFSRRYSRYWPHYAAIWDAVA